jgi:serine protease AprX
VLDEGFNYHDKHEALRDLPVVSTRDFVRGVVSVQDTTQSTNFRHGTWVLGVLAGRKFGSYVGAAFDAQIALGRTEVGGSERPQEMVNWAMGAEWADSLGADIISSSLGYFTFDPADADANYTYADMDGHTTAVSRAAQIAASKGILVVNSAGNEGNSSWHYLIAPSDVNGDSVIAVGAVDSAGVPVGFSSWGPSADGRIKPDVCARGLSNPNVSAAGPVDGYTFNSGTSFSQPLIAGLAACLMQARPAWTPRDVARALRRTASRASNPDNKIGFGIANGAAALTFDPTASVPEGRPSSVRIALAGENPVRGTDAARVRIALAPGALVSASGSVRVIDPQGRQVRELWEGVLTSDTPLLLSWDGRDDRGREVGRGLYFFALEAGGRRSTLRLVLLR